jgi:signal transduction histidine kinase
MKAKDFELEMANKRLEQLEQAKSKFVSVTAHQMRTPLSAIKWTFDMILHEQLGPVTGEQKEFLTKGFESTERMIHIVNDLLHVDHMEANKVDFKFAPLSLETLLDSVIFEFANQVSSKKIHLIVKKPTSTLPAIEADDVKLRIVLENLIDNAIKYTPPEGNVSVTLSDQNLNSAQGMVEVIIADSGIGIPDSEKNKIFSKFFRASNAIRTEPDGTGVGLYISKDIIEKHGGAMWYENLPEKGTAFHVTLPLRQKKL